MPYRTFSWMGLDGSELGTVATELFRGHTLQPPPLSSRRDRHRVLESAKKLMDELTKEKEEQYQKLLRHSTGTIREGTTEPAQSPASQVETSQARSPQQNECESEDPPRSGPSQPRRFHFEEECGSPDFRLMTTDNSSEANHLDSSARRRAVSAFRIEESEDEHVM